jgi:hypothetical protein
LFNAAEIVETEAPAAFATSRIVTWRLARFAFGFNLLPPSGGMRIVPSLKFGAKYRLID